MMGAQLQQKSNQPLKITNLDTDIRDSEWLIGFILETHTEKITYIYVYTYKIYINRTLKITEKTGIQ
jgi:hypothetical protein